MKPFFTAVLFASCCYSFAQEIAVKGVVYDKDSITPLQYAYVINRNSSTGIATDDKGKFNLRIHTGDTLCFSYVGYFMTKVHTHLLKDSIKNSVLLVNIYLKQKASELSTVVISSHSFSKELKEMYARKTKEYDQITSSALASLASPISALYYNFSKKGKELQQLSILYQQLLVDEIKESRLSAERVRNITGNDTLDVKDFLYNCFLPDQFVVYASDYDLFLSVKRCYERYMEFYKKKK